MYRMLVWFVSGMLFSLSVVLIVFGILFIRDVYLYRAETSFGSLILGFILIVVGGGLLTSTVAETVRKIAKKE
jgi:hypothetical protein